MQNTLTKFTKVIKISSPAYALLFNHKDKLFIALVLYKTKKRLDKTSGASLLMR